MILCGTALRPPAVFGPGELVRLAEATGCAGIAVGPDCPLALVSSLASAALAAGLALPLLSAPLVEAPLGPGRRLPDLCAPEDREERRAAVSLCARVVDAAADLGARTVSVELGAVRLATAESDVQHAFARGELDQGEPGAPKLRAAIEERRALSRALLDGSRFSLEALLAHAERRGITLAVVAGGTPWVMPSLREVLDLCADFRGGPLATALHTARLGVQVALGLAMSEPRRAEVAGLARAIWLGQAVGLDAPYLPGQGDSDLDAAVAGAPTDVPRALTGRADSTDREVAAAVF